MIRITLIALFLIGCGSDDSKKEDEQELTMIKWSYEEFEAFKNGCEQQSVKDGYTEIQAFNFCYCAGNHIAKKYDVNVYYSNVQEINENEYEKINECRNKYL